MSQLPLISCLWELNKVSVGTISFRTPPHPQIHQIRYTPIASKMLHLSETAMLLSNTGALRIGVVRYPSVRPTIRPLIAFDHLSLYIQKHLGQSVEFCEKVDHGRPMQSQVQPGTVRYSQLQYWKDPSRPMGHISSFTQFISKNPNL